MTIPAHVQNRDVQTAQNVLDAWVQAMAERSDAYGTSVTTEAALVLRGIVAATIADVREAGYLEGVQVGRRQLAHSVLDALDSEGYVAGRSDPRDLES